MKNCIWLKPEMVGQFEFTEWTPDGHLRHSKFCGLREDKKPGAVIGKYWVSNPQFLCRTEPATTLHSPIRIFHHDASEYSHDKIHAAGCGYLFPRNLLEANSHNFCRNATFSLWVIFCRKFCATVAPRSDSFPRTLAYAGKR